MAYAIGIPVVVLVLFILMGLRTLYEYQRGVVFRLGRHIERLMLTAAMLQLRTDATPASLADAVATLLAANDLADARVRITLTPGAVGGAAGGEPTTLVTATPLPDYPGEWYERGISVVVSSSAQIWTSRMVPAWLAGVMFEPM